MLRGVAGVTRLDCVRNEEIKKAGSSDDTKRRKDTVMENHGSQMGK